MDHPLFPSTPRKMSLPLILTLLTLVVPHSHCQTLSPSEQELVYLSLESINPTTPWRLLYPDDLCLSSPPGLSCSLFPDNSIHVTHLRFGFLSDSSPYPSCSPHSSLFPTSSLSLPFLHKLLFFNCFTHSPVSLPLHHLPTSLQHLSFINNPSLSGPITPLLTLPSLTKLILTNSNLTGPIPHQITLLPSLQQLTLSNNPNLHGPIPSHIGLLKTLKLLDFSNNKLTGSIPSSLGSITGLIKLDLSHNRLTGAIPDTLANLESVELVDLSHNRFGNFGIPLCLRRLTSLKEVYLSGNHLGGTIPDVWESLTGVFGIGFSDMGLVGNIPKSMGLFLSNASYIGLDGNFLQGEVPKEFGYLLENVNDVNLRNNRLTGEIPVSPRFGGMRRLKVEGNPGLCLGKGVVTSQAARGSFGNLSACEEEEEVTSPESALVVVNGGGGSCLFVTWCLVILAGAFWSFCL